MSGKPDRQDAAPQQAATQAEHASSGDHAVALLKQFFFSRVDKVAIVPLWPNCAACPAHGGNSLDALLRSHVLGTVCKVRWAAKGKTLGTNHLTCRLGSYAPGPDGKTVFAVVDFDGDNHRGGLSDATAAALAFLAACRARGIPCYLEKSRSGKGWHVWLFFGQSIPAWSARQLCRNLLPPGLKVEVFPKGDRVAEDGCGTQCWLPWWHGAVGGGNQFHRPGPDGSLEVYMPEGFELVPAQALPNAPEIVLGQPAAGEPSRVAASPARVSLAAAVLASISPRRAADYDDWLHIGMSLHDFDQGPEMLALWDAWSRRHCPGKWQEGVCAAKWATFTAGGGCSLARLVAWARQDRAPNKESAP
jgi:hypothetical protein